MITIPNTVIKKQPNFWNHILFHPTDAIEDPWGKRILDRVAQDGAAKTIRIYTMFEDIVYTDENGALLYDFRLSDLRIDYLLEKGLDPLLAFGGIPDCIAASTKNKTSVSKNKTRYKGKLWNSAPPRDYALWEEVCYQYVKHLVERYGIERVSQWRCQCFNEPDVNTFFLSELPGGPEASLEYRLPAYCKLYEAFEHGIRRVSDAIPIGGPALAHHRAFLGGWLDYVREHDLKVDFVSVHNYGFNLQRNKPNPLPCVANNLRNHADHVKIVTEHGFGHLPLVVDEWGICTGGFVNREDAPITMMRETELFSAYYAKLVHQFVASGYAIDKLIICLSGQHEMTEDFTGFRNFFTLNFIAKPIYNAYILASRLKENLLSVTNDGDLFMLATGDDKGGRAVLLTYADENLTDDLPAREETFTFDGDVSGKTVTLCCIDKENTNPYRLWERKGFPAMDARVIMELREEGQLKPVTVKNAAAGIKLNLTANCTYLITVE